MTADCLFCKLITGDIPSKKAVETEHILAFHDINPQAPTHVLVIHKQHTPSLSESPDADFLGQWMAGVRDIAKQLDLSDYRVVVNNGPQAGQTVHHLHAHILSGRPMDWPPG